MKFYYPKDKNGNRIGFKTPESQVYDTNGRSLTDKLTELNSNISGYSNSINSLNNKYNALNNALSNKQDKLTNPLTQSDIIDNLTSTSTTKPLSAKQGKTLNDKINTSNSQISTINNNISELNSNLVKRNGSTSTINPVYDVNNFYSGIGMFNRDTTNLPTGGEWWLIVSGGYDGTVTQTAYDLWNNIAPKARYCAAGSWSEWMDIKPPHSIVYKNFTMSYKSATEMYADTEAIGIPISFTVNRENQTPYEYITHTSMTRIGNTVMCSAYGSGFVQGHSLNVTLYFYQ